MITNKDIIDSILGRTSATMNRFLLHQFKQNGISITPERWSVLAILWEKDGCSQQEIARKTYKDKPATTRLIDKLEKEDFVVRTPDKRDRRINIIYLTEKGKHFQKEVSEIIDNTILKATQDISEKELLAVKETLDKIYFNIIDTNNTKNE